MKNKKPLFFLIIIFSVLLTPCIVFSQTNKENYLYEDAATSSVSFTPSVDNYYRARILSILEEGEKKLEDGTQLPYQKVNVEILGGVEQGKRLTVENGGSFIIGQYHPVKVGEIVVLNKPAQAAKKDFYYITDIYRLNRLISIIIVFFILAILFGRKRGISSVIGMVCSILIIFYGIVPNILKGSNPLFITLAGSVLILLLSLYLAHGFNKRTSIALLSSILSLGLAVLINLLFVSVTHLSGMGTEEAFYLQFDNSAVNLKGILLSGIIISVLGILDDVTTGQTAAIGEINDANPKLLLSELYRRGMVVGREHIASLINTLVLAYVGVSFPLILLFALNKTMPLWLILNSNFIAEEIVRTIVGSSVLVLAVPLSTLFAAYFFSRKKISQRL